MNEDKGILIVLGNQNLGLGEAQYFFSASGSVSIL